MADRRCHQSRRSIWLDAENPLSDGTSNFGAANPEAFPPCIPHQPTSTFAPMLFHQSDPEHPLIVARNLGGTVGLQKSPPRKPDGKGHRNPAHRVGSGHSLPWIQPRARRSSLANNRSKW
jgi:hypothetical protein